MERSKIVICTPTRGEWKGGFGHDYAKLVTHSQTNLPPEFDLGMVNGSGTLIHELRRDLARDAIKAGADWIFWLDDDMRFPKDALCRLLARRRDIVGCNYIARKAPYTPTARNFDGGKWTAVVCRPDSTGLEKVYSLGFGCILTSARVFKQLAQPWFSMPWSPSDDKHIGEDVYFCATAGEAGFEVQLDHDLSRTIKHVGEFEYGWDHYDAISTATHSKIIRPE